MTTSRIQPARPEKPRDLRFGQRLAQKRLRGVATIFVVAAAAMLWLGAGPLAARASAVTIPIVWPLEIRVPLLHDYLAPRVGHLHQGTDLLAPKMTKELAAVSGTVTLRVGTYSGWPEYSLWLKGDDGHGYFYIHINNDTPGTDDGKGGLPNAFAPGLVTGSHVQQGQFIAYVGDSGNAEFTVPHLHFEIHETTSMSSPSMNPYDSLAAAPMAGTTPPPSPPPQPVDSRSYSTLRGANRYETAIKISKAAFASTAPAVVLTTGESYPDALTVGPLAKAYGGPILLTPPTGLTAMVKTKLARLKPAIVFIVGLPQEPFKTQLRTLLPSATVRVLTGADRYQTAAHVAAQIKTKRGSITHVVVVSGIDFASAISIEPIAAAKGWPILLTPSGGPFPTVYADILKGLPATAGLRVGTRIQPAGYTFKLLLGANRFATNTLVADYALTQGFSLTRVGMAIGEPFSSGLTAGPYLAGKKAVLLLTEQTAVPSQTSAYLRLHGAAIGGVYFFGLSDPVVTAAEAVLRPIAVH